MVEFCQLLRLVLSSLVRKLLTQGVIALSFLLVVLTCFSQPSRNQDAYSLINQGNFARAKVLLEKSSNTDHDVEGLFSLGKLYYLSEDFEKSEELLEKATDAQPGNSEYFLWFGRALGRRAEKASPFRAPFLAKRARDAFRTSVALDSNNLEARDDLLTYYLEAPGFLGGGKDKAIQLAEQIKDLHPCHYLIQSAQICESQKHYEQAEDLLQKATSLKPMCLSGLLALAEFYQDRRQWSDARATLQKAVQCFPDSQVAHFELGRFEVKEGVDLRRGCLELNTFLKLHSVGEPYPFMAYYLLGEAHLKLDQPAIAIDQFEQALRAYPAHAPSLKGLAEAKQRMNHLTR